MDDAAILVFTFDGNPGFIEHCDGHPGSTSWKDERSFYLPNLTEFGPLALSTSNQPMRDGEWHESLQREKDSSSSMCSTKTDPSAPIAEFQVKSSAASTAMP